MTLHSLRDRALYVTPIRVALGVVWLLASRLAGTPGTGALLAFAGGAFLIVFTLFNDPRSRFLRRGEAKDAPADVRVASRVRQALHATLPSTAGVSALAGASLAFQPVLSAFLGGISTGLGIAGALYAVRADRALLVDPRSGVVYRRT
jgi:hypothetical protein